MNTNTVNKMIAMFDMDKVKKMIADCPADEIVILCGHWSINKPKYDDSEDPETSDFDWTDMENVLGETLYVNDYDDLVCDPHGIMQD